MESISVFLGSSEEIEKTPNIFANKDLINSSYSSTLDKYDELKKKRLRRNEREKKRQQHLQKLLKRIEVLVNANKPSSEHVYSERLVLDRAIEMIKTSERKTILEEITI